MSQEEDQKPVHTQPTKSSMEILSELFSTFDAEPPLIIKKEKDETPKKHKKSKKKHKHKEKRHKRKDKKRKRSDSSSTGHSEVDLAELLIKQERQSPEKKMKVEESEDLKSTLKVEKREGPLEKVSRDEQEKKNSEEKDKSNHSSKITIKDLKFSSVFEQTLREVQEKVKQDNIEEGELSSTGESAEENYEKKGSHKRKHKHKSDEKSKKKKHSHRSHSKDKNEKLSDKLSIKKDNEKSPIRFPKDTDDHKTKLDQKLKTKSKCDHHKTNDKYKEKDDQKYKDKCRDDYYKEKDDCKSKYRDNYYKDRDSDRSKYYDDYKHKYKENPFYKEEVKDDSASKHDRDEKWFMKNRYRGYNEHDRDRDNKYKDRSTSRDRDRDTHIDKKKLLEIARKNAIQMMKSGSLPGALTLGPQAQEKVLAAIKAGGKTIEELTDFCKTLSKKEELGELSSVSGEEDRDNESDSENKAFHHPFQIKDRPTAIVMNIKNSVPLPTKTAQERTAELRMQFPVSSGTQHRKTENEWVPVSPKKTETSSVTTITKPVTQTITVNPPPPLPIEPPPVVPAPVVAPPGPQVFPANTNASPTVDIGSIVSQRLLAMRKLQENPYDVEALSEMHKSQQKMQTWAESKQQPGQFTGSTGAQILTQAELAAGYQAWARKDQLQNAAPVCGGMGMHLLKKMGWNPGEGLGKDRTGALEPLLLEVKLDKKGLVANEEQKRKQQKIQKLPVKTLEGKHPVSLLGEYTAKRKLGAPQYTLCMESGPDHKKMFLFKVIVNGIECQPDAASPNKKQAKADAARLCLQNMGILPS